MRIILLIIFLSLPVQAKRVYLSSETDAGIETGEIEQAELHAKEVNVIISNTNNSLLGGGLQDILNKLYAPSVSQKITYIGDGVTKVEFYNGPTQTTINRLAKVVLDYTGDNVTGEDWELYDSNGTTVLKSILSDYSYAGDNLSTVTRVTNE